MIYIDLDAFFKKLIEYVLDFLFPPKCIFCKKVFSEKLLICAECENTHQTVGWINSETKLGPALIPVDGVFAGCKYTELVKSAIVRLKFYDFTGAAAPLAYIMSRGLKNYCDLFDVIIPVPLSKERLSSRGFNQSELISAELCKQLQKTHDTTSLLRIRHTKKQSLTKGKERHENVASAFQVTSDNVIGKKILLIDDVLTTGSTTAECARVLREAGAEKIYVGVVALAV